MALEVSLADWLEQKHTESKSIETAGIAMLKSGDGDGYRKKMRQRAELLASLYEEAAPLLNSLPQTVRQQISDTLRRFSDSAATSLKLNSVFYMSALLYPDEYVIGEPDNLEKFIAEIKTS